MKKDKPIKSLEPIEIIAPSAQTVVAATTCPKCGQPTKFCSACGGRFCDAEACTAADPYHREECRDHNNVGN